MSDPIKRALRTWAQGFVGILALIAIPRMHSIIDTVAGGGEVQIDTSFWQSVAIAAAFGGFIALISFVQNELEQQSGKSPLK